MAVTGTLEQIRSKVRRITGRLSANQLTDAELDDYINDFYQYDFPAHLKTWNLSTQLTPIFGADDALIPDRAFYVFDWNAFTNVSPPFYVGGYEIQYFQDREAFFNFFPTQARVQQLSTGTGVAGPYAGTITGTPILEQGIFISAVNNAGASLHCTANNAGVLQGDVIAGGTINYQTGAIAGLTWNAGNIAIGEPIWAQSVTYASGRPQAVLFIDGTLFFYPVPDIAYEVSAMVYQVPDELTAGDQPIVRDWWNLIAYGASMKIFAENLDMESYNKILPIFDQHKRLVERRTLVQLKNQRTATIYTQQPSGRVPFSSTI
jgi:hypothetical protein